MIMTYEEYKKMMQDRYNKYPLFFAFSDKQLKTELDERNVTIKDIFSFKAIPGAFYLKSDAEKFYKMLEEPDPIKDLMKDPDFAYEAFAYELRNHEYCYNYYQGDWDVITSIFGEIKFHDSDTYMEYLTAVGYPELIQVYQKARQDYYNWCDENEVW